MLKKSCSQNLLGIESPNLDLKIPRDTSTDRKPSQHKKNTTNYVVRLTNFGLRPRNKHDKFKMWE